MRRHKHVELVKSVKKVNWLDEVGISVEEAQHRAEIFKIIPELKTIWDGHLGRIKASQLRIELSSSDSKPVHWVVCKAIP